MSSFISDMFLAYNSTQLTRRVYNNHALSLVLIFFNDLCVNLVLTLVEIIFGSHVARCVADDVVQLNSISWFLLHTGRYI
jgi:hypothetical protein